MPTLRGIIFDLDGTLVDSGLDFHQMRREMELPPDIPILEAIADLAPEHARRAWNILEQHEQLGAARATLMPGAREFVEAVARRGWARAIVTRNCRASVEATLTRLGLEFESIYCRDDGPFKPDPAAIHAICRAWQAECEQTVMLGDYWFDIEAGRRAGARTVLYARGRPRERLRGAEMADLILESFLEPAPFFDWVAATFR